MFEIPRTQDVPLIRTDFSDDARWLQILAAATAANEYDFRANVEPISDVTFNGAKFDDIVEAASRMKQHPCIFVADAKALSDDGYPILCVESGRSGRSFRVVASELWSVENNLSLANMGFEEFEGAVDAAGVFRGFK